MEIVLTGKPISAQRAYEIGLVNRIAEPAALMDAALELAREVLEGAPLSVAAARETVMLSTEMGRAAAIDAGYEAHVTAYTSEDAQEGPLAFSQKRKPEWKGR
jgi:enoyl-CoA hydratase/carnithine racemase